MKNTPTAVRLSSIDRCRRRRCRRAEESQLFYLPRLPQEHAACRRLTAAVSLAGLHGPRALGSTFAIATRPLLLLLLPMYGSAALRIETSLVRNRPYPRRRELSLVCFGGTLRMH